MCSLRHILAANVDSIWCRHVVPSAAFSTISPLFFLPHLVTGYSIVFDLIRKHVHNQNTLQIQCTFWLKYTHTRWRHILAGNFDFIWYGTHTSPLGHPQYNTSYRRVQHSLLLAAKLCAQSKYTSSAVYLLAKIDVHVLVAAYTRSKR